LSSSAEDLRDIIQANWQFDGTSGNLRLSKFSADPEVNPAFLGVMNIPVKFFDRPQVEVNLHPKAIEVVKVTQEGDEGVVQHPQFNEITDNYYIKCRYFLTDVSKDKYSLSQSDMQEITDEVTRILDLTYLPSGNINSYFITRRNWENQDNLTLTKQKELIRILRFSLTKITSNEPEVFTGFGGVLVFDTSASTGDNKPGGDYTYTEAYNVVSQGGFEVIEQLTRDSNGIAKRASGMYTGQFICEIRAKSSDVVGATTNLLDEIGLLQTSGELPEVVLLQSVTNTEGVPVTLTQSTKMMITNFQQTYDTEDLVVFKLTGEIIQPPVFTKV